MHIDDRFPPLTRELLAGPLRQALGSDTVALDTWECAPVRGGGSGHGVFRITGAGHDRGQACSWSMILKVFTAQDNSNVPTGLSYWRREPLAYQSGLLAALPRGLSAPRCFGVVEPAPDVCGIWLEDLGDAPAQRWTRDDYYSDCLHLMG